MTEVIFKKFEGRVSLLLLVDAPLKQEQIERIENKISPMIPGGRIAVLDGISQLVFLESEDVKESDYLQQVHRAGGPVAEPPVIVGESREERKGRCLDCYEIKPLEPYVSMK